MEFEPEFCFPGLDSGFLGWILASELDSGFLGWILASCAGFWPPFLKLSASWGNLLRLFDMKDLNIEQLT